MYCWNLWADMTSIWHCANLLGLGLSWIIWSQISWIILFPLKGIILDCINGTLSGTALYGINGPLCLCNHCYYCSPGRVTGMQSLHLHCAQGLPSLHLRLSHPFLLQPQSFSALRQ